MKYFDSEAREKNPTPPPLIRTKPRPRPDNNKKDFSPKATIKINDYEVFGEEQREQRKVRYGESGDSFGESVEHEGWWDED